MTNFYNTYNIIYFHIRSGMEKEFLHYMEKDFIKKAHDYNCLSYWTFQHNKDGHQWIWTGYWNRLEDVHKFEHYMTEKSKEFSHFCERPPKFEIYKNKELLSRDFSKERRSA